MINKLHIYLFTGLFILSSFSLVHEFHLSKGTVNYDSKSSSLQVTLHIFIDDLEVALAKRGIEELKIGTEKESNDSDQHIKEYISDHLIFISDSDTLSQVFLGKENSDDLLAIWCYLEIEDYKSGNLSVENTILTEIFDDQKNIVAFKVDKKRLKDELLDKSKTKATVTLK